MASLEKETKNETKKKDESSSEETTSSDEEEDDQETKTIKSEVLAKLILEEIKSLRFDIKVEIRNVCNHLIKQLNQSRFCDDGGEKPDVSFSKGPESPALQEKSLLGSLLNITATQNPFGSSLANTKESSFGTPLFLKCELLPPIEDKPIEFCSDLDIPMTTDSASTCSNSDKNFLSTTDKDSCSDKERVPEVPSEKTMDKKAVSVNISSSAPTGKKNESKSFHNLINLTKSRTKVKKQNYLREKRKIRSLKALSLCNVKKQSNEETLMFCETPVELCTADDKSTLTRKDMATECQEYIKATYTSTSLHEVDEISPVHQKPHLMETRPISIDKSTNVDLSAMEANTTLNWKTEFKSVVSPLCLSSSSNAFNNKVFSKLKSKQWKYRVTEKAFLTDASDKSAYSSTTSICKDSPSISEIACRLKDVRVENSESLEKVSSTDDSIQSLSEQQEDLSQKESDSSVSTSADEEKQCESEVPEVSEAEFQRKCDEEKSQLKFAKDESSIYKRKCTSYECDVCKREFPYSWMLKDHMKQHTNERMLHCQICDKPFNSDASRNQHLLASHFGVKCFECVQCGKFYSTLESLKLHKKSHSGLKPFICQICSMSFALNSELERHTYDKHSDIDRKPFECDTCSKSFFSETELIRHCRIHTGIKPYPCKKCRKRFRSSENLMRHMSTHSERSSHQCNECGSMFSRPASLKRHSLEHSAVKKHECEECGKTFAHSQYLKFHMLNHTGKRPYQCPQCNKSYKNISALKKHESGHYTM